MHHTTSVGTPRIRNSRQATKLRRENPRLRGPMSATRSTASGSAGESATLPRYHVGTSNHEEPTSTTTVSAHTQSTAGEIVHDAHPVQRQAHPLERTRSTGPESVASACWS